MAEVKALTENNFEQEVIKSELPVLVDFWAPWCGPCKMLGPIVDSLATDNSGKLNVGKVNVDDNKPLAVKYGIRGVPTLIFFKGGQEVKRIVGAQNKNQLQTVINEMLA
jgi:thioredoxin 1